MIRYPSGLSKVAPHLAPAAALADLTPTVAGDGLMVGRDRENRPVTLRVLRPEPTRLLLVGGLPMAQLMVFRLVALGVQVIVQSLRPQEWAPFVHRTGIGPQLLIPAQPGEPIQVAPAGRSRAVVIDVGPVTGDFLRPVPPDVPALVVRHEVTAVDADLLTRVDAAIMQQLTPAEAAVAAPTTGLSEIEHWLTQIRPSMVAVLSQRTVRWVMLGPTDVEAGVVGPLDRFAYPVMTAQAVQQQANPPTLR
ncbi:hypothetical protein AB0M02_22790 [Actinoplanes sp. NPDC051861]|uniref:hypothetical protein n=1 Tax=Actinoplanes sp. NPDC051861 TaxID=3155170 RepID=UPI00341BA17F